MVTAHIASISTREESLKRVIQSMYNQVDAIFIALNDYKEVPAWLSKYPKAQGVLLDNQLKDTAKFLFIHEIEGLCLVWDDDLCMPNFCVRYLELGLKKYGGVVGLHGKVYDKSKEIQFKKWSANYRCLGTCAEDARVDIIGSGVMLFDNRQVKLDLSVFEYPGMADVTFSRVCHQQNIPMTVLKHPASYLTYVPPGDTIWRNTRDFTQHNKLLNEFLLHHN